MAGGSQGTVLTCADLSAWLRCPFSYWCQRQPELRVLVRPRPYLAFGDIIHRTLRCFYALPPARRLASALMACFDRCWQEAGLDDYHYRQGRELLSRYLEHRRPQDVRVRFLEVTISLPLRGHVLRGRLDRVDEMGAGAMRVVDYKTGHVLASPAGDVVARAYALMVLRQLSPPPTTVVMTYDYLRAEQEMAVEFTGGDVPRLEREVGDVVEQVAADGCLLPRANTLCRSCDFRPLCPESPLEELLACHLWEDPVRQVEELARRHGLPGLWRRLAQAYLFAGDQEAALEAAARAVQAAPGDVWARYQMAAALMAGGHCGEAARQLRVAWQQLQPKTVGAEPGAAIAGAGEHPCGPAGHPCGAGEHRHGTGEHPCGPAEHPVTVRLEVGVALVEALLSQMEAVLPPEPAELPVGAGESPAAEVALPPAAEAARVLDCLCKEDGLLDDHGVGAVDEGEDRRENGAFLPNLSQYRARLAELKARLDLIRGRPGDGRYVLP